MREALRAKLADRDNWYKVQMKRRGGSFKELKERRPGQKDSR